MVETKLGKKKGVRALVLNMGNLGTQYRFPEMMATLLFSHEIWGHNTDFLK
jgi:hypothetical protein